MSKRNRFGWLRFLTPRSPVTGVTEISDGAALIGHILRANNRRVSCRACNDGFLTIDRGSPDEIIVMRCDACDTTIAFKASEAAEYLGSGGLSRLEKAEKLSTDATRIAYAAIALLIIASVIAIINQALWTLIGGAIISTSLTLQALTLRYRSWQLARRRLFEDRAPLGEWIMADLLPALGLRK